MADFKYEFVALTPEARLEIVTQELRQLEQGYQRSVLNPATVFGEADQQRLVTARETYDALRKEIDKK